MLVVGEYNIVCLGDWEFNYAAPTEYQCSLVTWLILSRPHTPDREWITTSTTLLDLFLQLIKERENKRLGTGFIAKPESRLSKVIWQGKLGGTF